MSKVKIELSRSGQGILEIDGTDMSGMVTGFSLESTPKEIPTLHLGIVITETTRVTIEDARILIEGIELGDAVARELYDWLKARFEDCKTTP